MDKNIFKIIDKLPDTKKLISQLENINETLQELLDYVKILEDKNTALKKELLTLYK